jgi:hypothetical protein
MSNALLTQKNVESQNIRRYAAQQEAIVWGAAAQQVNWEFELAAPTKLVAFGVEDLVTVAINLALTAGWITNIRILINQSHIVVDGLNRAEYIQAVELLETKENTVINNGEFLFKVFDPPLPKKTRVQIQIIVNTLALSFPGGVVGATGLMNCYTIDADTVPVSQRLTFYRRIPNFPPAVGLVAGQAYAYQLGNFMRKEKAIIVISQTAAAGTDINCWRIELLADGKEVIRIPFPMAKKLYQIAVDAAIATPAGWALLKAPGAGFQPAQNAQLTLQAFNHTADVAGDFTGFEIYEQTY